MLKLPLLFHGIVWYPSTQRYSLFFKARKKTRYIKVIIIIVHKANLGFYQRKKQTIIGSPSAFPIFPIRIYCNNPPTPNPPTPPVYIPFFHLHTTPLQQSMCVAKEPKIVLVFACYKISAIYCLHCGRELNYLTKPSYRFTCCGDDSTDRTGYTAWCLYLKWP